MGRKPFDYQIIRLDESTYLINEFFSTMFLLCGHERALVIDCGAGVGDFRGVIEKLTSLPYDVVATHAHVDHIGGRCQFDKIHVSVPDCKHVRSNKAPLRKAFVFVNGFMGNKFSGLSIKSGKEPDILPIENGDEFDLGGRTVRAIFTPGHTVGSTSFLDVESRRIFIGDVSNAYLLMYLPHCTTIDEMIVTMNRLIGSNEYDTIWSSHRLEPETKDTLRKYLAGAMQVAQQKNTVFPLIKTNDYQGAKLLYRTNIIHKK